MSGDEIEITRAEAEALKRMRAAGIKPETVGQRSADGSKGQETAPVKPAGDDDRPVTVAELERREQARMREMQRVNARQALESVADKVITSAKDLGKVSPQKAAYLRERAFELASQTENLASMSPPQLQELLARKAEEAVKLELEERGVKPSKLDREDLDRRLEAGKNSADRSSDAGSGSAATTPTEAQAAASELLVDMNDMEFGPGVEVTWPSEEAIRHKRGQAADAFLRKAYGR